MNKDKEQTLMKTKKGFVFTLDVLIAAVLVFLVVLTANNYASEGKNTLSNLQTVRTGSDIVALMENTNGFSSLNENAIKSNLSNLLPKNYNLNLNISCSNISLSSTINMNISKVVPGNQFVGAGKRFFTISSNRSITNYCTVNYLIW